MTRATAALRPVPDPADDAAREEWTLTRGDGTIPHREQERTERGHQVSAAEVAGLWLGLVYAHPDRPPAMQRDVLTALAVDKRLTGDGPDKRTASIRILQEVCQVSRSTVQRALRWARQVFLLVLLKRGHRVADGIVIDTSYRLAVTW